MDHSCAPWENVCGPNFGNIGHTNNQNWLEVSEQIYLNLVKNRK